MLNPEYYVGAIKAGSAWCTTKYQDATDMAPEDVNVCANALLGSLLVAVCACQGLG